MAAVVLWPASRRPTMDHTFFNGREIWHSNMGDNNTRAQLPITPMRQVLHRHMEIPFCKIAIRPFSHERCRLIFPLPGAPGSRAQTAGRRWRHQHAAAVNAVKAGPAVCLRSRQVRRASLYGTLGSFRRQSGGPGCPTRHGPARPDGSVLSRMARVGARGFALVATMYEAVTNSITQGRVVPGFSHVEIVQEEAVGRRGFSGIFRFPRSCTPALFHSHLILPSSTLKTSLPRSLHSCIVSFLFLLPEKRGSHKGHTGTRYKSAIASTHRTLNWRAVFRRAASTNGTSSVGGPGVARTNRTMASGNRETNTNEISVVENIGCSLQPIRAEPPNISTQPYTTRPPPTNVNRVQSPAGPLPGFSHVGIMPDDAVGPWIFSEIFHFPCPYIPALLHTYVIGSQDLFIKSRSTLSLSIVIPRVPGVARTNRAMVSGNTETNTTEVSVVENTGSSLQPCLQWQEICAALKGLTLQLNTLTVLTSM
ncbi:hypothetical protein PR048_031134 [Dryococelus australis]|uniref:Uncharacterized protein n=1 Tax=Dryococelus australis TaxID=614101 RepID=A0ABQ9G560_9NEOP|nr:hypothetical protein PR048_031134 [Dryococelus australis]